MNIMLVIFSLLQLWGHLLLQDILFLKTGEIDPVLIYHRLVSDEDLMLCRKSSMSFH
jgi:hypothetical protein